MARTQTMVQLTSDLVASLDELAARRSMSRSALIREFVVDGLRQSDAAAVGERIADGYRRVPQMQLDEWGIWRRRPTSPRASCSRGSTPRSARLATTRGEARRGLVV